MVLISVLIKIFESKPWFQLPQKRKLKPKPKHGIIMDKLIDMPLLEQVGFGVVFWSELAHDASVCGPIALTMGMASPTCLENHRSWTIVPA